MWPLLAVFLNIPSSPASRCVAGSPLLLSPFIITPAFTFLKINPFNLFERAWGGGERERY